MPMLERKKEVRDLNKFSSTEKALAERSKQCKDLELSQKSFSMMGDIFGDINSVPLIGEVVGTVAAGFALVSHVTSGSLDIAMTALDCADVPFEQLQEFMQKQFNEVNRKLDGQSEAVKAVSRMVNKTLSAVEESRREMNEKFDEVLESIEETKIEPVVSKINNFVRYFQDERERIRGLKHHEYVAKLEATPSLLVFLRESRTPISDNSLNNALFDIMKHGYAIPNSNDDEISFKALYALLYGTEAHISVMTFLLEQYSYLANYHYERAEIDKYNKYFESIYHVFEEFKLSLVGSGAPRSEPLLDQVIQTLKDISKIEFLRLERDDIIQLLNNKIDTFIQVKEDIDSMVPTTISETPQNYVQISFIADISLPIGEWEKNAKVSYAVQYRHEKGFSLVGKWSDPVTVETRACPTLRMPVDRKRRQVFIFRKFENSKPQLVGSVMPYQESFFDINRDFYNAAGNPDIETGSSEAKILLETGAKATATFEKGKTALHATANSGNLYVAFKILTQAKPKDINTQDEDGYTPMHVAVNSGNAGFVKFLINQGAFANLTTKRDHLTPLHLAANRGFVKTFFRLLESPGVNVNERDSEGYTPLHHAVLGGKYIVSAFIKNKMTEINPKSTRKLLTPFHLAVMNDDLPVAQTLMESQQVDINAGDKNNMTPLHYASMLGYSNMLQYLLSLSGINSNPATHDNKWTPLHYAIFFKHDDIALQLLEFLNTDYSSIANSGITPLHFAVTFGRKKVVLELLAKKVNIDVKTTDGYTPLHLAAMGKDPNLVTILLNNGANIEAKTVNGSTPLLKATLAGRPKTALVLINKGANLNASDNDGQTPIHGAALNDQLEIIKQLLTHDPNIIDTKNKNSDTPLNLAAQSFHTAIVKYLIKKDADVNTRNNDGISPLIAFAKAGNLNMVKYLIDKGADVYIADNEGINFLYYAIRNDHRNIVEYASNLKKLDWGKKDDKRIEKCPEVCSIQYFAICDSIKYNKLKIVKFLLEEFPKSTCEPLSEAARFGHFDIVKYLVEEKGMDVNSFKDHYNPFNTPLCNAAIGGHLRIVKYLLKRKAEMYTNCNLKFAIDLAIEHGHINIVKFLSENGADLRKKNRASNSPVYTAFNSRKYDILTYFIKERTNDIDLNDRDTMNNTLLMYAVASGLFDVVKLLVEKGADVTAKNDFGETALDMAKNQKQLQIAEYLQSRNARYVQRSSDIKVPYLNLKSDVKLRREINHNTYENIFGKEEDFKFLETKSAVGNVDIIGTVMLMDVIIRYLTNQKYIGEEKELTLEADIQTTALKITENFESLLDIFQTFSDEEQIDFSEVHKNVYKSLKDGKQDLIHQILCASLKTLSTLTLEKKEMLSDFLRTHFEEVLFLRDPGIGETFQLLGQQCFMSEKV